MPAALKAALSVAALLVCLALFFYDLGHGAGAEKWVVLLLGPLMVFGIWVFPETEARNIRKQAAQKRAADDSSNHALRARTRAARRKAHPQTHHEE